MRGFPSLGRGLTGLKWHKGPTIRHRVVVVETHGGSIRAKSPGEGQGATFTITLPITVVHPERPEPQKARPKPSDPPEDVCQDGALAGHRPIIAAAADTEAK